VDTLRQLSCLFAEELRMANAQPLEQGRARNSRVARIWDDDGREARLLARAHRLAVLYDAKGDLLFHGGLQVPWHEGDTSDDQLRASIDTGRPAPLRACICCALAGVDVPPPGENR